jgi:hypothetical protein
MADAGVIWSAAARRRFCFLALVFAFLFCGAMARLPIRLPRKTENKSGVEPPHSKLLRRHA